MTHRKKIRMLYIHIDIYINNTINFNVIDWKELAIK